MALARMMSPFGLIIWNAAARQKFRGRLAGRADPPGQIQQKENAGDTKKRMGRWKGGKKASKSTAAF